MKNLLNRLSRIALLMLLLVDRTPNFGILVNATWAKLDVKVSSVSGNYVTENEWSLDKSVNTPTLNLPIGANQDVTYTVTATKSTKHNFTFDFSVTVKNKNNRYDANFKLEARILKPNGDPLFNWKNIDNNVYIGKNTSVTSAYSETFEFIGTLPSILPFKIEVRVTAPGNNETDKSPANNSLVSTVLNNSLHVVDSFAGAGPWDFTNTGSVNYVRNIESANVGGTHTVDNTVTGDYLGISDSVTITVNTLNAKPVANSQTLETFEEVPLGIVLTGSDADGSQTITYELIGNPSNGTLSGIAPNLTYTPNLNYVGTDTFTFKVNDGFEYSSEATVSILVKNVNDAPVAVEDAYALDEGGVLTTTLINGVLINDSDVDSPSLTPILVTNVTKGTLVLNADGTFTYTPNVDYFGDDFFEYKVTDGALESNTVKVSITVNNVNDAPVAQDGSFTVLEGATHTGNALGVDVDSSSLTFAVVGTGTTTNGTVVVNADGSFTYTHNGSETLTDSFEFTVSDGALSDTGLFTITVTPVNDAPVAVDDMYNTNEDQSLTINSSTGVLINDTDAEGNSLKATKLTNPSHGTLVYLANNGSFKYIPNFNYRGVDTFTYKTTDSKGASDTATVTINVISVNDVPYAKPNSFILNEDTMLNFTIQDLLNNDFDADGDVLTITGFTQPSKGSLVLVGNAFTYTPSLNFFGMTSFNYTISDGNGGTDSTIVMLTVLPINDNPVAMDDAYSTNEDQILVVNTYALGVLSNDSDVDNAIIYANLAVGGEPRFGTVTIELNGRFTYTPNANFSGIDTFVYRVRDVWGGSDTATVTINVTPVSDAPVAIDDPDLEDEMEAYVMLEDTSYVFDLDTLLANDFDPDDANPQEIPPAFASRVMEMPIISRSFDFNTYFTPSVGSLVLDMVARTLTYTPALNYVGPVTFEYNIIDEDENISEPAVVTLLVTPVNDAPVANPLAFSVANAGTSTASVSATDVDVPADTLTFSLLTPATNGTVTVSPTGVYTYTHNGSATLSDTFVFSVTDGALSSSATVTITVLAAPTPPPVPPVNLAPVANPLAISVANGGTNSGTLSGSDPEGAPLSFSLVGAPANGTVVISPTGAYSYTHNGTTTATDSFTFSVSDGSLSATATVSVRIRPVPAPGNTPPVVVDGNEAGAFGEVITGTLLPLGSDADGDPLTFILVNGPSNGTLVFNPNGTFTYTPDAGFAGTDRFTFNANDGKADSNDGTFTFAVAAEEVVVADAETPLVALPFDWFSWLAYALAGLLAWLLAFLRPNMKYTLTDKANNQKVIRRRLAKPNENTMMVELKDKDMVDLKTINVEFYKRLAKNMGNVTVNFQLNGKVINSVVIPEGIDDSFETLISL